MRSTISHRYLDAKLDGLERLGFSRKAALSAIGLTAQDLRDRDARLSLERLRDLLDAAATALDDPWVGLRLGHKFRIATYAQTGTVYAHCRTLRQVIDFNSRYQRLAIDAGDIAYVSEGGDRHLMQFTPYYDDLDGYRQVTDIIMGAYATAYRWLSWSSGEDVAAVHLPYGPPKADAPHHRIFQTRTHFGSDRIGLEFTTAAMEQVLTTHDAEKLARAQAQLDYLLGAQTAANSLDAAVEAAIRGAIENGQCNSDVVALRLGRSWPALRNDLKGTDRNFRDRVDAVRMTMFHELYGRGRSFAQIAQDLAYNDQPSFNRAFKRWYNLTPSQWRAQQDERV